MTGMAEVLAAHHVSVGNQGGWYCSTFACGSFTHLHDATIHQAAALTAAGFGPVKEAGAMALEEAAAELLSDESAPPKSVKEMYNAIYATWLQRRAAAVRGEG